LLLNITCKNIILNCRFPYNNAWRFWIF